MRKVGLIHIILFGILFVANSSFAGTFNPKENDDQHLNTLLLVWGGYTFMTQPDPFFDTFHSLINEKALDFESNLNVGLGFKLKTVSNYRFGLSVFYLKSKFSDHAIDHTPRVPPGPQLEYLNKIDIEDIPFLATAEFVPYITPYKSYIGMGLGVSARNISWDEFVANKHDINPRKGGVHFSERTIVPVLRIFSGMELAFDDNDQYSFLGSFMIEVNYTFFFKSDDIFQNIKQQFPNSHVDLNRRVNLFPGYLGLNFGFSINMHDYSRRKK